MLVLHLVVKGCPVDGEVWLWLGLQMLLKHRLPDLLVCHKNLRQLVPGRISWLSAIDTTFDLKWNSCHLCWLNTTVSHDVIRACGEIRATLCVLLHLHTIVAWVWSTRRGVMLAPRQGQFVWQLIWPTWWHVFTPTWYHCYSKSWWRTGGLLGLLLLLLRQTHELEKLLLILMRNGLLLWLENGSRPCTFKRTLVCLIMKQCWRPLCAHWTRQMWFF